MVGTSSFSAWVTFWWEVGSPWDSPGNSRNNLEDTLCNTKYWPTFQDKALAMVLQGRGREEGLRQGRRSGNICSHQEMIITFQRHRNQLCLVKYYASPSRHTNKNLTLITWFLFYFFSPLAFLWALENKTEQAREESPVAKHLWLFIVIISFLHFEKNSNLILHFWGLSIIRPADQLYHWLCDGCLVSWVPPGSGFFFL